MAEPPPPEVIQAEANSTPNRKYRLIGAGTGFGIALGSGVLSAAVLAGQPDAMGLRDLVLFDNPIISLLVDVIIGGACAWAWQQEQLTKEQNIQRIWEEVQRRRAGGAKSGANRSQRRSKSQAESRPVQFTGGGGFSSPSPPPPAPPPPPSPPPPPTEQPAAAPADGGLFGKVNAFFEEANELGRTNALALNAQLEDAGVLPVINPPSASGASGEVSGEASGEASASPAAAPATADAVTPIKGKGKSGGKGKKGKKGKKR